MELEGGGHQLTAVQQPVAESVGLQGPLVFWQTEVACTASILHKGATELHVSVHPKDAYIHCWKYKHTSTHTHTHGCAHSDSSKSSFST